MIMRKCLLLSEKGCPLILCLLFSLELAPAQFVNLTAQVEIYNWSGKSDPPRSIHCVVGTNSWEMDGDFCRNCRVTNWFTGREIIEHSVVDRLLSSLVLSEPQDSEPPVGTESTRSYDSLDGNPAQPVRVADHLTLRGRIGWLAFCSGPCLKRGGREIFPPSDLWKELIAGDHFADLTKTFEDSLGLPRSLDLYSTGNQTVVQYRVTASTNVLGWEFPTEFYLAQYRPAPLPGHPGITVGTNGWQLEFTAKGKVNVICEGTKPEIPPEVLRAAGIKSH